MRIIGKSLSVLLLVTALLNAVAKAQNQYIMIAARSSPFCGLLKHKIYCYGGEETQDKTVVPVSTLFELDITQASKANMSTLRDSWKIVTPNTAGVNTEERGSCQYATVGGTRLVLSGCYNCISKGGPISNQTIVYDVETNSWKSYPNYLEQPYGNRQIYQASTVEVPLKGIAFYGGTEEHFNASWSFPTNQNISATQYGGVFRAIGYTRLTYLDIDNAVSPWTIPPQDNVPSTFSAFQTSIFDPQSKTIYFFGGQLQDTLAPGYNPRGPISWHSFSYALTFNTETNVWDKRTLTGNNNAIPTNRTLHSTTLLPNNGGSTVLLYGGEGLYTPSNDYCYTLDLKTFIWTQHNIQAPSIDPRRSKHSAVLANNDSLFIIHGLDGVSTTNTVPIVLNVSNPATISYMEAYTDPNAPLIVTNDSKGLPSGAIAGIAVGASVICVLGICLFLRKKKTNLVTQQRTASIIDNQEPVEVDWDEIEKHYSEMPPGKLTLTSPTAAAIIPSSPIKEQDQTTPIVPVAVIIPSSPISDQDETTTIFESSAVRPSSNSINNHMGTLRSPPPDAIDETSPKLNTVKPDGGDS